MLAALVPILIVLMTVVVGAIILSVLLPIYDLTGNIS
jgi:general secretion pathway protein F